MFDFIEDELIAARGGATLQMEDYKGNTIYSRPDGTNDEPFSFVATDDALVASTRVEDVKAALDAHSGDTQGLADDTFFSDQLAELSADHLGRAARGRDEETRAPLRPALRRGPMR